MCFLIGPLPECQSASHQGLGSLGASSLGLASPPLYRGRFSPVLLQSVCSLGWPDLPSTGGPPRHTSPGLCGSNKDAQRVAPAQQSPRRGLSRSQSKVHAAGRALQCSLPCTCPPPCLAPYGLPCTTFSNQASRGPTYPIVPGSSEPSVELM